MAQVGGVDPDVAVAALASAKAQSNVTCLHCGEGGFRILRV